jgi:HK97 family phage major capsid protein
MGFIAVIRVAPLRRLTIRNLLRNETTTSNLVEYARELEFINNAGPQFAAGTKENVLKNESGISFELVQDPIVTLAHWLPASKQILDDAPKLQSFIGNRLLQGLKIKEEDQLLNGDGKLGNLAGCSSQAISRPLTMLSAKRETPRSMSSAVRFFSSSWPSATLPG